MKTIDTVTIKELDSLNKSELKKIVQVSLVEIPSALYLWTRMEVKQFIIEQKNK